MGTSAQEKEGSYQLEKMALEERQERELKQAEKFTKLYKMDAKAAAEHMESVKQEQKKQQNDLAREYGKTSG
jgi:hypothetical protein